jgi:predicted HicB family RNase H-like nuclease
MVEESHPFRRREDRSMAEDKGRYTEAQKRSAEKYLSEKVEDIRIRVPKGQKAVIKAYAEAQGKSVNQFILECINEGMK